MVFAPPPGDLQLEQIALVVDVKPGFAVRLPLISRTDCGSACGSNSSIRVMPVPGCTSVTRYRRKGVNVHG